MATKPLEQKRGKVNIEAANSVMANPSGIQDTQPRQNIASWVAEEQPRARLRRYGARANVDSRTVGDLLG